MKMDDPKFIKRFASALRPGAYFSIVEEGAVRQGDPIEIESRPEHDITIKKFAQIYLFEHDRLADLLAVNLPDSWRTSINERVQNA